MSGIGVAALVVGALFLLLDQGIFNLSGTVDNTADVDRQTAVIERRNLSTYETIDGTLEYSDAVQVVSSKNGVLTYIASEGSSLDRGAVIFRLYRSVSDSDRLNSKQQIASREATVAQAEKTLANLNESATVGQIASADAVVAQAEAALDSLTAPITEAQITSANLSVNQAEKNVLNAKSTSDLSFIAFKNARRSYCEAADDVSTPLWIYDQAICPVVDEVLSDVAVAVLKDNIFAVDELFTSANNLLDKHKNYRSNLRSLEAFEESWELAVLNREALNDPADIHIFQQRTNALTAAQEQRAALNEAPSDLDIKQTTASLESANIALDLVLQNAQELLEGEGPSATVVMFGQLPMWREFRMGMESGEDIRQLKENLFVLGYGNSNASFVLDSIFDKWTEQAIKTMQNQLNINITGRIDFGDIVFVPGTSLMAYSPSFPNIGMSVPMNMSLASLIPTEKVITRWRGGAASSSSESLQTVQTSISISDKNLIELGSEVEIELPDESAVAGFVKEIGSIAIVPTGNQGGDPYLTVSVGIAAGISLPEWSGAPVTVSITKSLAQDVLAAPVTSLLALLDGGYAIEMVVGDGTQLIPVEVGIYSGGWVEISGPGLDVGTEVIAP